jgi:hypothetical protein
MRGIKPSSSLSFASEDTHNESEDEGGMIVNNPYNGFRIMTVSRKSHTPWLTNGPTSSISPKAMGNLRDSLEVCIV